MEHTRTSGQIALHIEYHQSINYAMLLNGNRTITDIYIKNISGNRLDDICVRIGGFYFPSIDVEIGIIEPDEIRMVPVENVMPDLTRLLQLNEAILRNFK